MPYFLRLKAGESLITGSSRYGNIRFLNPVNGSGGNFTADVYVLNNSVTVYANSTYNPGFNKSANITLYGLAASGYSAILRDGVQCPLTVCYAFTDLNAGTVAFNVSSWSNYSIGNDTILPTINFTNPTPANATTQIGNSIFVNVSATDINYISSFIDFDSSLVAWWRMDDLNSSGGVVDYTGRNNGSVFGGAVQNVSGRMGKSFSFDGADDKLTIPNSNSLVLGNNDFAISFWIVSPYTSNVPWAGIIRKGGTTSAPVNTWVFYKNSASNTSLRFNAVNDTTGQFSIQLTGSTVNGWNNVLVTRSGNTSTMYVNGLLADTDTTSNANLSSTDSIVFANGANGVDFLSTSIDDVVILNRSLSANEVMALYANMTTKYYWNNFTALGDGDHTFKAYAQDTSGNVNFTETRTVSVDTILPVINFTNPTPANGTLQNANSLIVNVSASDSNNISSFIDFDNSLVSWWRMDDLNSSGGVVDYMGRYNGTVAGHVQNTSGKMGKSFSFDGSGDYVVVPQDISLNPSTPNLAISLWVKPYDYVDSGTNNWRLLVESSGNLNQATGYNLGFDGSGTDFELRFGDGVSFSTLNIPETNVPLNQWTYVVGVINGTNSMIYLNGVLNATASHSKTNITYGNYPFAIATLAYSLGGSHSVNGSLDDIMIFNRTLSSAEISALYANTSTKYYNNNFTNLANGNNTFKAYAQDIAGNVNFTETRTVVVNAAPSNGTAVVLNSSLGFNRTLEDLNARTTLSDLDNNAMNVTVFWYNNSVRHLTVMYNNSYANGTTFIAVLGHGNTTKGHNWTAGLTISDGMNSFTVNSSVLTVLNTPPNVTLISPLNGSITI